MTAAGGASVSGATSLDSTGTVLTFTPSAPLTPSTVYTVVVSGATNTSGAAMTTPHTWQFTTSNTTSCPCTLFGSGATPSISSANDSSAVTLGVRFTADTNGWITGVHFYKGSGNTGTHIASLWSSGGTLLAQGTFTGETATGWQTMQFTTPVAITAGTTYVVGYYAPNGHYSMDPGYFSNGPVDNAPLHAQAASGPGGNGVYAYGADLFPGNTYNGTNYWVDPVFTNTQPASAGPQVISSNPASAQTNVPTGTTITFTFDKEVQGSSIGFSLATSSGQSVPGSVSYDSSTNTGQFTPASALSNSAVYTATVTAATGSDGSTMVSPYSWTFTTAAGQVQCPCTLWPATAQPAVASAADPNSVELGVKFQASEDGWITGIRFYKGSANTGTHTGSLWDSSGNLLGQVTFTNETASGWQEADFSTPVQITAGTTYVASYLAPNGGYSVDSAGLASATVNGPLIALASGSNGGNGVYLYTHSPQFPSSTYNANNYWVDVVFTQTAP